MNLEEFLSVEDLVRLAIASILILVVMILTRYRRLGIESDLLVATVRAFVQLMILALFLDLIFDLESAFWMVAILVGMMTIASYTSTKRAMEIPQAFRVCAVSIVVSSTFIIGGMVMLGVIPLKAEYVIPLGGMVIGNSMNITSLAIDRLKGEVANGTLRIENMLALGATSSQAVAPMMAKSVRASLIPTVDNMKTLGLVWIPGLMSGMIIGGVEPTTAAVFQLIIIFMILASNTIASLISTRQLSRKMFGGADQLIYRP
jgi:putative ABC transport system permease protein